jgi:hypothetical protein
VRSGLETAATPGVLGDVFSMASHWCDVAQRLIWDLVFWDFVGCEFSSVFGKCLAV